MRKKTTIAVMLLLSGATASRDLQCDNDVLQELEGAAADLGHAIDEHKQQLVEPLQPCIHDDQDELQQGSHHRPVFDANELFEDAYSPPADTAASTYNG